MKPKLFQIRIDYNFSGNYPLEQDGRRVQIERAVHAFLGHKPVSISTYANGHVVINVSRLVGVSVTLDKFERFLSSLPDKDSPMFDVEMLMWMLPANRDNNLLIGKATWHHVCMCARVVMLYEHFVKSLLSKSVERGFDLLDSISEELADTEEEDFDPGCETLSN